MKKRLTLISISAIILFSSSSAFSQSLSVLDSFDALHDKISREYAFTEWKRIDWDALYQLYQPRLAAADASGDVEAYYLALREYVHSIPDGHVGVVPSDESANAIDEAVAFQHIGGGYGFSTIGLDDGRIVAQFVLEDGPAAKAGIEFGAEIVEWKGQPIESALDNVSVLWSTGIAATNEGKRLQQYKFIGRAPVGETATVTFKNGDAEQPITTSLIAEEDGYETLSRTRFTSIERDLSERVSYEILPSGYGYIKITVEEDETRNEFTEAVAHMVDAGVPGLILDLRHNVGGDDFVAADMSGLFYTETVHYETVVYYDEDAQQLEHMADLYAEPQETYYGGPVVAMVSNGCISSGEGPAMMVQKLPQGQVVSFYASNGSFGITDGEFGMPYGFTVLYPIGQSLNAEGIVQLDGDSDMNGGVIPDVRVPLTDESVTEAFVEGRDVELEYAASILQGSTDVREWSVY